jgi:hypothetical protein
VSMAAMCFPDHSCRSPRCLGSLSSTDLCATARFLAFGGEVGKQSSRRFCSRMLATFGVISRAVVAISPASCTTSRFFGGRAASASLEIQIFRGLDNVGASCQARRRSRQPATRHTAWSALTPVEYEQIHYRQQPPSPRRSASVYVSIVVPTPQAPTDIQDLPGTSRAFSKASCARSSGSSAPMIRSRPGGSAARVVVKSTGWS